jgi:threonine dehydrogenase-like Zn-dependent dehydrogenase
MESVCVVGTGPIGLTMGQVARAAGAKQVIMIGRRDELLQFALQVGAADAVVNNTEVASIAEAIGDLTDGELCDAVFETVGGETVGGESETMAQAVEAAAFGGQIGIIGAFWGDVAVAYRAGNRKELDVRWCNSYSTWHGQREFQIALDMVAEGRVQAAPLITHRFPLTEIGAAFAAAADKRASGAVKVIVQP